MVDLFLILISFLIPWLPFSSETKVQFSATQLIKDIRGCSKVVFNCVLMYVG